MCSHAMSNSEKSTERAAAPNKQTVRPRDSGGDFQLCSAAAGLSEQVL